MELGPRDRLSQAFVHEVERGRTTDSPYGPIVHLDLRHLGEDLIDTKLPFVRELCLKYERIDPVHELVPVRPVVHYMMGGVHTDIDGATPLDGLYAAGETACVSINGANRLGSNSLPELLVFGARAGKAAAEYASQRRPRPADHRGPGRRRGTPPRAGPPGEGTRHREHRRPSGTRCRPRWRSRPASTGPDPPWPRAPTPSRELQDRIANVGLADTSRSFNTELLAALELANMLDIGECILQSGLQREESRGAHQRTDFPDRDDDRLLVHQLVHRNPDGTSRVEPLPVTITRWPPGERVYGR